MGMHIGLVAARTTVAELRAAFVETFPHLEVADPATFASLEELSSWMETHQEFVSAAEWRPDHRGRQVIAFWQDGPWAVFADTEKVLPADDERLAALSERFPTVLSFIVESAAGVALFACFEQGRCRRRIENAGHGEVTSQGEPLAAEAGIDTAGFYMDGSERLARALGMSALEDDGAAAWTDFQALCVADQTDYSALASSALPAPMPGPGAPRRKPWWKLW